MATPPLASTLNLTAGVNRAVSTYAPLAFNGVTSALTYNDLQQRRVHPRALRRGGHARPVPQLRGGRRWVTKAARRRRDRRAARLGARTVPGAGAFVDGLKGSTSRRG